MLPVTNSRKLFNRCLHTRDKGDKSEARIVFRKATTKSATKCENVKNVHLLSQLFAFHLRRQFYMVIPRWYPWGWDYAFFEIEQLANIDWHAGCTVQPVPMDNFCWQSICLL